MAETQVDEGSEQQNTPSVKRGDMVEYSLHRNDVHAINYRRVGRFHDTVYVGEVCTLLVTRVHSHLCISGKVMLDGPDTHYVREVTYGEKFGEWCIEGVPL